MPVLPHIASGALQAYAVTTSYRLPSLPDVPTVAQAGIPGYDASQWFALATTAGAAPARVALLNKYLREIVQTNAFTEAVSAAGMRIDPGSPEDLGRFIVSDRAKWQTLVKDAGLKIGE
jgi:tripartite-type tricarboxylate transporter receptor subunit TctC